MSAKITRRILIGFDSSRQTLGALEEAVEMAARMDAELVGIFVEDENLLRLAALPCASEVSFATAKARNLNLGTIERTFRHMADEARRAMARAADRRHVRWSFVSERGSVVGRLLASVAGEPTRATRGRAICAGIGAHPRTVLLLQIGPCVVPHGKAVIVLDGHYTSAHGLPMALALAEQACTEETLVLVNAESPFDARRQQQRVAEILQTEETKARIHAATGMVMDDLLYFLKNENCGTLILCGGSALFDRDAFVRLVEDTEIPVFVIS